MPRGGTPQWAQIVLRFAVATRTSANPCSNVCFDILIWRFVPLPSLPFSSSLFRAPLPPCPSLPSRVWFGFYSPSSASAASAAASASTAALFFSELVCVRSPHELFEVSPSARQGILMESSPPSSSPSSSPSSPPETKPPPSNLD